MVQTLNINLKTEDLQRAHAELFHVYGAAMAAWAAVERQLFHWFWHMTGMSDAMARSIFYGARGFGARAEMLESAVEFATRQTLPQRQCIKDAIKKATQYSSFRNKIAHGEQSMDLKQEADGSVSVRCTIIQADDISLMNDRVITIEHLGVAVQILGNYISESIPHGGQSAKRSPEECRALILALPNDAHVKSDPTAQAPSQSNPGESQRVNKKEYRAAQQDAPPEKE